jgi:hypothetical protein
MNKKKKGRNQIPHSVPLLGKEKALCTYPEFTALRIGILRGLEAYHVFFYFILFLFLSFLPYYTNHSWFK